MMKIAHITTTAASLRYLLLAQFGAMQAAGYEVVGISSAGPDVSALQEVGIRHISVPMTRSLTTPASDLKSLLNLYSVMRRERFTVVHTHNPKSGVLGQLAAAIAKVPIVVNTIHGFYIHDRMNPLVRRLLIGIERTAAKRADLVLSQNREDIELAVNYRICSSDRIRHIGNGIDLARFNPSAVAAERVTARRRDLGIPHGASVVGFVGRLAAKRKGFLDFLTMAKGLSERRPDVHFVIVGESDAGRPDAVSPDLASSMGVAARCRFLGQVVNTQLPEIYSLMDVVVLPSIFEGFPRVLMEAAAMGIPVVASRVKGNREAVIDGETGLLVPYGDTNALTQAVERILADCELATAMGAKAKRLAQQRFDETAVFARILTEYQILLQRMNGTPLSQRGHEPVEENV
jgi:glycosyltransferase involved in cell wall biosynthesis